MRIRVCRPLITMCLAWTVASTGSLAAQDVHCSSQPYRAPKLSIPVGPDGGWVTSDYAMVQFDRNVVEPGLLVSIVPDPTVHAFRITTNPNLKETGQSIRVYFNPWVCQPDLTKELYIKVGVGGNKNKVKALTIDGVQWLYVDVALQDLSRVQGDDAVLTSGFVILSN